MLDRQQMLAQLKNIVPEVLPEIRYVHSGRLFAHGSHHQHYRVETTGQDGTTYSLIVRIPFASDPRTRKRMLVEHLLLQFLRQQGHFWVPDSLYFDGTGNRLTAPFAIQRYCPGTRPRRVSKRQVGQLARMMGILHSLIMPSSLSTLLPVYRAWEDVAHGLVQEQQQWFHELAESSPPEQLTALLPVVWQALRKVATHIADGRTILGGTVSRQYIVHGDVGRHNLLQAESSADAGEEHGLYLLDWEFATSGDPAFDVAVFFQNGHLKKLRRTIFSSTYQQVIRERGGTLVGFWERVMFYEPVVLAQTALWALGELFSTWPQARSFSQIAWYGRCLYNRLASIDLAAGEQATELFASLLKQRFPDRFQLA